MKPTSLLLLIALTLTASAEMKCAPGKCGSATAPAAKPLPKVPAKPQPDTTPKAGTTPKTKAHPAKAKRRTKPTIEQLFNVRTVKVKRMPTAKTEANYGYIVADESRRVEVSAWFDGFVEKLYANTCYQKVTKGDPLAKLYAPEVYKAKQDYLNAIRYNTQRPSPGMLRGAKEKLILLNVDPKEIKAIEKTHRTDAYTTLYAPASGWIFQKSLNEGSSFKKGAKLFEIVNLQTVWMEAKLFQNDLVGYQHLDHFRVKVKGVEGSFNAQKSLLYPTLNPKEATATLRLTIDNPDERLKPGMYATLYASSKKESHLVIPRTAAIRKEGVWYAFLATAFKGEYEPAPVEIEPLDSRYFIVKEGLSEGEAVVDNALFMMDSDAQINGIY